MDYLVLLPFDGLLGGVSWSEASGVQATHNLNGFVTVTSNMIGYEARFFLSGRNYPALTLPSIRSFPLLRLIAPGLKGVHGVVRNLVAGSPPGPLQPLQKERF